MNKVKDNSIKQFYKTKLTGCDQLTYKALQSICDERGIVNGCYYKEIVEMLGYCEAQFYRSLYSLEEKGLIDIANSRKEKTITLYGNSFSLHEKNDKYRNYSDLNLKAYDSEHYKELRAGARRILEYFIFRVSKQRFKTDEKIRDIKKRRGEKIYDKNLNSLMYRMDKNMKSEIHMYNKIRDEVFGADEDVVTFRMFREYIKELKDYGFISVGYGIDVNGKQFDIITVSAELLHTPEIEATERGTVISKKRNSKHNHYVHFVKHICRMFRIDYNNQNMTDVALLLVQYSKKALEAKKNIYAVLKTAISLFARDFNCLDSKVVHALTKKVIAKDYTNTLLVY